MKTIVWIYLLNVFMIGSIWAVVSNVKVYKNPENVVEGNDIIITCNGTCSNGSCVQENNGVLRNVKRNDKKVFTCIVKDTGDQTTGNASTTFDVYYGPDSVSITPNQNGLIHIVEDTATSIQCSWQDCHPTSMCNLTWWKSDTKKHAQKGVPSLSLFDSNYNVKRTDAGSYRCEAARADNVIADQINIIVQYSPDVNLNWHENSKTFTCVPEGVPKNYTFYTLQQWVGNNLIRNNIPLTVNNNVGTYKFSAYSYQDTGNYTCIVNNGITSGGLLNKTRSHSIEIKDNPVIVMFTESYKVSKGARLSMILKVYARPSILTAELRDGELRNRSIILTKDTINVNISVYDTQVSVEGERLTLSIPDVLEEYFNTTLTIRIRNAIGIVYRNVTLIPEGAPDVPGNFSLVKKTHNSVKLKLVSGFFNGAPQTLVILYRKPGNKSEWLNGTSKEAGTEKDNLYELSIYGLDPEVTYEFKAYSYNKHAKSSYTRVITDTLYATPFPTAIVVGTICGVLLLLFIIIIVLFVWKRRRASTKEDSRPKNLKNNELTGSIAMSPSYGISPTYANNILMDPGKETDGDVDSESDNLQNYENTHIGTAENTQPVGATSRPDSVIYQNTVDRQLKTFNTEKSRKESTNGIGQSLAQYVELTGGPAEKVEEVSYLSMTDAKALTKNTGHSAVKKQDSSDNGYLDMNQSKELVEKTRLARLEGESKYANAKMLLSNTSKGNKNSPGSESRSRYVNEKTSDYSNMQFATDDYENVKQKISPLSQQPSRGVHFNERESVPDYDAPPPPMPLNEEENYENIKMK